MASLFLGLHLWLRKGADHMSRMSGFHVEEQAVSELVRERPASPRARQVPLDVDSETSLLGHETRLGSHPRPVSLDEGDLPRVDQGLNVNWCPRHRRKPAITADARSS